jgi:phage/plasmid-associated DNA primase
MSTRSEIDKKCEIILAKNSQIIGDDDRINSFVIVRTSYQLHGKKVPESVLNKLNKRLKKKHTDPETEKIFSEVDKVVEAVKNEELLAREMRTADLPEYLYYDKNGNLRIEMKKYARYLQKSLNIIYYPTSEQLFIYDEKSHCYRSENTGNEIDIQILKLLEERDMDSSRLTYISEEITKHLKSMENQEKYPFNNSKNTIPVKNGILKLNYETGEVTLLPHGPDHHFNYTMNAEWNPDEDGTAAKNIIRQWVSEENVDDIIQIPAQAIVQKQTRQQLKRSTLLIGIPNTGKSKCIYLIQSTMGEQYISSVSLQEMSSSQFATGSLENAILNIVDDMDSIGLNSVSRFKDLTGGVFHGIERKGKQPYPGIITCGWLFSCNFPPSVVEKVKRDTAFWIRWNVLLFKHVFPEVSVESKKEIITDEIRSSFLKCIVEMVIKVHQNGKLISEHAISDVMTKWISNCDTVMDFIDNAGFEPVPSGGEPVYYVKENLKNVYEQYCAKVGFDAGLILMNKSAFYSTMQNHGFYQIRRELPLPDGSRRTFECFKSWMKPAGKENIDGNYYVKSNNDSFGEINIVGTCLLENIINKVNYSEILKTPTSQHV